MKIAVPFLTEDAIERDADALLREYASARGVEIRPPVPIEDIVEKHLKLRVDFDDLHQLLGVPKAGSRPDILGAIWVDKREIYIDQSLDPEVYRNMENRYRFTLAHEGGGHWRLHRTHLSSITAQPSLFSEIPVPAVVCRSSQAKERIEWQADVYASCLLMPRVMVLEAWRERFQSHRVISLPQLRKQQWQIVAAVILVRGGLAMDQDTIDDSMLEWVARPFAKRFLVSPTAMRIRLEKLGLLQREMPAQRSLGLGF